MRRRVGEGASCVTTAPTTTQNDQSRDLRARKVSPRVRLSEDMRDLDFQALRTDGLVDRR